MIFQIFYNFATLFSYYWEDWVQFMVFHDPCSKFMALFLAITGLDGSACIQCHNRLLWLRQWFLTTLFMFFYVFYGFLQHFIASFDWSGAVFYRCCVQAFVKRSCAGNCFNSLLTRHGGGKVYSKIWIYNPLCPCVTNSSRIANISILK